MGVKDALLLNLTGSNFEALQTNDTARIKGDFSIKNTSDVEVFGFDASKSTITVSGNITSSANISSSLTGSFGRIVAQTYHGDGFAIRDSLPRSVGLITSSAQIASQISGAFEHGFEASASISGSRTVTGSFGRLDGNIFRGDGSGLKTTLPRSPGIVTSSAQLATSISGSFNKGFEYTGTVKGATVTAGGTWSAGGALGSSISYHGAAGDKCGQIVAMGLSGNNALSSLDVTRTFEYNGTSWSEAGDSNTNRARVAGAGTVNSGVFFGGYAPGWYGTSQTATETYNGTNFSEVNDMIMGRRAHMGAGLSGDAALALGGYTDSAPLNPGFSPNMGKFTEVWNGTNWSESGDAPKNMKRGGMAGSVNSAVVFGSNTDPDLTLHWDGSSWSEGGSGHSPIGIDNVHGGTQNDAISAASGYVSPYVYTKRTQYYDGTTWSDGPNMINAYVGRGMGGNQGNAAGALASGGEGGPVASFAGQTATEEHTGGEAVITGSFGRVDAEFLHGDGTNITSSLPFTAGIVSGSAQLASSISGSFNKGFEFSGEITGGNASFGRLDVTSFHGDGSGLKAVLPRTPGLITGSAQLATAISGSFNKGFEFTGTVQTSPGGTWSAGGNLTRTTYLQAGGMSGTGTKFAGLFIGGRGNDETEEYDGTSFTQRNDLSEVKNQSRMTGTTEAALVFGGSTTFAVEGKLANTEEYNGTNWSEVNNLTNARWTHGKLGITSEAAKAVAGQFSGYPASTNSVEDWNGTNWSEGTDMPVAINSSIVSAGTYDSGIIQGPPSETYCWNGSSWSDVGTINTTRINRAGGFGTSNDALIAGGCSSPIQYLDSVELFNGTTWSSGPDLPAGRNNMSDADSLNTGTCAGMIAGGVGGTAPHYCNSSLEYSNNISSFTAHQVKGNILKGDGSGLTRELAPGLVSSSAQLATSISGSFNKGFAFGGEISGSRTSTGSFGRVETTNIAGNAKFATGVTLPSGTVSASAQLASSISGSFNKGFEYVGELAGTFADIITNGGFDADSDWTQKETGWTISDGKAVASNVGYSYTISQNVSEVQTGVEQTFRATVTISDYSAGTLRFIIGTSFVGISMTANGTFTQEITTTPASQKIGLLGASGTALNCKIDNVKVEILSPALRVATSGSFGRVEADKIFGDATKFKSNLTISSGVVSASAQLASSISGSFNKGFEFGGNLTYTQRLTASYVGVSGSSFAHAGNATTMSISSICGSDFDYRLDDGITAGQIKGSKYGTGAWSTATAMNSATHGRAMAGTQNAFLSIGGYSAPTTTTTEKFNGSSWSVSAPLNSSAKASAGVGTQNAAGMFGGYDDYDQSEFYNGAAWSNGPNMGTSAAYRGSAGTQNAGLIYGGNGPGNAKRSTTELYNGNVFTETADLNTARGLASAGGTQNDAIYASGLGSPTGVADTEIWNGTTWSEVNNVNTARWGSTGIGTANHHIMVTGHAGGAVCNNTEEWNGTSWSETSDLISLRAYAGNAAGGLGHQGIYAGGYSSPGNAVVGTTELWDAGSSATGSFGKLKADFIIGDVTNITQSIIDGTSFLTGSSIIASRISGAFTSGFEISSNIISYCGSGTSLAKSYFTGVSGSTFYNYGGGAISSSYCGSDLDLDLFYSVNNIRCAPIGGVWKASAHMLNIKGISHGATGVSDALIVAGGVGKDPTAPHAAFNSTKRSEEFDGTSWSALSDLYGGHTTPNIGAYMGGTVHAAWITAAYNYGAPQNNYSGTENWNGVSWYDSADTNTPRRYGTAQGSGTQNAGIIAGGKCSSLYACTELFNGNVWTETADLIQASVSHAMVGTQNDAAIAFGDCSTGGGISVNACAHQGWDGTSWRVLSNPAPQAIGRTSVGGGIPNDSVFTGYQFGPPTGGRVCYFDGTSWSNLGGAFVNTRICSHIGGDGNANSLIFTGGCTEGTPDVSTGATEIWTGTTTVTGSFGIIKPRGAGIKTEAFKITSSLFQLPVFNDDKINYVNNEGMQSTGSLSGSVDRVADVIVGQKLGEMWFDEGKNAIGYTYQSRSLISQSLNYGQIFNNDFCSSQPGVYATQSVGYFTQSFFQCTIRTCYLTASLN